MLTYLYIIQIIVAATLITLILLQAKGGGLGGVFGGEGGMYRTRRGVEKTLFQATIVLSVVFFLFALITVIVSR